jgi:cold shock CspA family protein
MYGEMEMGMDMYGMGMMKGKGGKKGFKGKDKDGEPPPYRRPEPTGKAFSGTVKSRSAGYGFIECMEVRAEYNSDVYTHISELKSHQPGETVYFELALNTRGQPQALNVVAMAEMSAGVEEPPAKKQKTEEVAPVKAAIVDAPVELPPVAAIVEAIVDGAAA